MTAARLLGIPLPKRLGTGQQLHVATRPPRRSIRAEGVVGHKLDLGPSDVVQLSEVHLTSAARTWTDLANLLTVEDLVVAGDFLLWRRNPLASIGDLRAACSRTSGKRGAAKLRIALPLLTDRSDSPPESRIRYRFLRGGLPAAIPNLDLHDDRGRFLARPDLTFVEYREVYDYEGDHHRTDAVQWEKDLARIPRLEQANWHSTRGSKRDLQNTGQLIERLGRILRSKGWEGRRASSRLP